MYHVEKKLVFPYREKSNWTMSISICSADRRRSSVSQEWKETQTQMWTYSVKGMENGFQTKTICCSHQLWTDEKLMPKASNMLSKSTICINFDSNSFVHWEEWIQIWINQSYRKMYRMLEIINKLIIKITISSNVIGPWTILY